MNTEAVQADDAASGYRVLVVEDEILIRIMVADDLRDHGFSVFEAANGDEAIALLSAGAAFDAVFTDVRMPGLADGLALLAYVRGTRPDLPVLVTSGHLRPELALSGGAADFLPKPYDSEAVASALRAALEARR